MKILNQNEWGFTPFDINIRIETADDLRGLLAVLNAPEKLVTKGICGCYKIPPISYGYPEDSIGLLVLYNALADKADEIGLKGGTA